jgi:hypothetical protein
MSRLWKSSTREMEVSARPTSPLVPMLLGMAAVGCVGYFVLGLKSRAPPELPELMLRIEGESLTLPSGATCALPHDGCAEPLGRLPVAIWRLLAPAQASFAVATPVLHAAAERGRSVLLDEGRGPVEVFPTLAPAMKSWSDLNIDAAGMRLRIILRADGFWVSGANGKVLGADPRGPTLPPKADGQDFDGLAHKLELVRREFRDTEDVCAVLPSLDITIGDVIRTVGVAHQTFREVKLAVP